MSDFPLTIAYGGFALFSAMGSLYLQIFLKKPHKEEFIRFHSNLPRYQKWLYFNENLTMAHEGKVIKHNDYMRDEVKKSPFTAIFIIISSWFVCFIIPTILYVEKVFITPQDLNTSQSMKMIFFIVGFSVHIRALFFGIRLKRGNKG